MHTSLPPSRSDITIAQLWRYPVKGMRGQQGNTLTLDATGVAGDRRYAIESSGAPRGKPLLTGAERAAMLLYTAAVHQGETRITTPSGETFHIHDPALLQYLQQAMPGNNTFRVVQSATPLTDVRPIALLGLGSVQALATERGEAAGEVDPRRFRANILLHTAQPFAEDNLAGQTLQLGATTLRINERTPRCRMVTLHPETAHQAPAIMRTLDPHHNGRIGIYATVLQPGPLSIGDTVASVL